MAPKPYTPEDAHAAAARGAAWMDKNCEGWTLLIDLSALDLESSSACILGQTAHCVTRGKTDSHRSGSYNVALDYAVRRAMRKAEVGWKAREEWAEKHGFVAVTVDSSDYQYDDDNGEVLNHPWDQADENQTRWEMLNIAWREEIRKRAEVTA